MSSQGQNQSLFVLLVTSIVVVVAATLVAMFVAGQKPVVVVVSQGGAAAPSAVAPVAPVAAPAPTATAAPVAPASTQGAAAAPPQIQVTRLNDAPALDDPFDARWEQAPMTEVALQPQQIAHPMLEEVTVHTVNVQALRDEGRIVFRLSWKQAEPSEHVNVGRFSDAAALQFPMVDGAPFTMGGPDMPVRLLYWRANWQKDVNDGFQDVQDQHPHAWSDMYWFATGEPPFRISEAFEDPRSHEWLVAYRAGNPMADFTRTQPVEELVAEGFGTLTHVPQSPSRARGQWRDGYWTVVIDRPFSAEDPLAARLQSLGETQVSLAVWDGAAGNVGAKKQWSNWVNLKLQP